MLNDICIEIEGIKLKRFRENAAQQPAIRASLVAEEETLRTLVDSRRASSTSVEKLIRDEAKKMNVPSAQNEHSVEVVLRNLEHMLRDEINHNASIILQLNMDIFNIEIAATALNKTLGGLGAFISKCTQTSPAKLLGEVKKLVEKNKENYKQLYNLYDLHEKAQLLANLREDVMRRSGILSTLLRDTYRPTAITATSLVVEHQTDDATIDWDNIIDDRARVRSGAATTDITLGLTDGDSKKAQVHLLTKMTAAPPNTSLNMTAAPNQKEVSVVSKAAPVASMAIVPSVMRKGTSS